MRVRPFESGLHARASLTTPAGSSAPSWNSLPPKETARRFERRVPAGTGWRSSEMRERSFGTSPCTTSFIAADEGFGDMSSCTRPKLHITSIGSVQRSWNSYQVRFLTHGQRVASAKASRSLSACSDPPIGGPYSVATAEVEAPYSVIQMPMFGLPMSTSLSWNQGSLRNEEPVASGACGL